MARKISNGPNDRPLDETISQTGPGIPDDSSRPVHVDEEEVRRVAEKLKAPPPGEDGGSKRDPNAAHEPAKH